MSAPEEYETEAGYAYRGVRDRHGDARAPDPAWYGNARTSRPGGSAPRPPRWGSLPARRGVVVVLSATVIGVIATLVLGGDPGALLGTLVIVGSVAAAMGVEFRRGYLLIPVPAVAYAVGATAAGMFHDRGVDISHTALAVSAAQWLAHGFPWMTIATIAVIVITVIRWLVSRQQSDRPSARSHGSSRGARSATRVNAGRSGYRR